MSEEEKTIKFPEGITEDDFIEIENYRGKKFLAIKPESIEKFGD